MPAAEVAGPPAADAAAAVEIETSSAVPPASTQAVPASPKEPWSVESGARLPVSLSEPRLTQPPALRTFKLPNPAPTPDPPLPYLHFLERLKTTPREGWRRFRIVHGESISDHMYRMAIITMLAPPAVRATVDVGRCTQLALVHDMAESLVGDITPMDNVDKDEKHRRERETMEFLTRRLLGTGVGGTNGVSSGANDGTVSSSDAHWMASRGEELLAAWTEYEAGQTREAVFVKDVDKLELLLQMSEYERRASGVLDLGEFAHVAGGVKLPEMREWAAQLLMERDAFWDAFGGKTKEGKEVENLGMRTKLGL